MSYRIILDNHRKRVGELKRTFDTIYERVKIRIEFTVQTRSKVCVYEIPKLIYGYPLVDVPLAKEYIIEKLRKEGFIVYDIDYDKIFITWDLNDLKNRYKDFESKPKGRSGTLGNYKEEMKERKLKEQLLKKQTERANDDFFNHLL